MTDHHPIHIAGLAKRLGGHAVLTRCDLVVPAGSVTGLLGVNGAGKTTLLRCLVGLARPDAGTVRILGDDAWDLSAEAKARLGFVPQTPVHFGWMRVSELIAYHGAFYPRWDQERADHLCRAWSIPTEIRAAKLSPGEAQRLALVLALSHRPDLLVLDEPAASLDPLGRRQFLTAVLEAAGAGVTVLVSTHLCADLERIADRVAVLRGGRITEQAGLDELKEQVRSLRIHSDRPLPADLSVPHLLSRRDVPGGAVLVVRREAEAAQTMLRESYGAESVIDGLPLEDIAVELLR